MAWVMLFWSLMFLVQQIHYIIGQPTTVAFKSSTCYCPLLEPVVVLIVLEVDLEVVMLAVVVEVIVYMNVIC